MLIGESGSGKTTLLRMIAGFEIPTSGSIFQEDRVLVDSKHWTPPEQRHMGMLFQDYALFPHLNVLENVTFGLHRLPRSQRKKMALEVLAQVQLEGYETRYPHTLSGGQQQRVALARALAPRPSLLLLDEPFSNLDVLVKAEVRDTLFQIIRQTGISTLSVMHDIQDAMRVADRLLLLQHGHLIQMGSPQELYEHPCHPYVAQFMGKTNLLSATASNQGWDTDFGHVPLSHACTPGHKAILSIRPEHIDLVATQSTQSTQLTQSAMLEGMVIQTGFAGRYREVQLRSIHATSNTAPSSGVSSVLSVNVDVRSSVQIGETLRISPHLDRVVCFAETTAPTAATHIGTS